MLEIPVMAPISRTIKVIDLCMKKIFDFLQLELTKRKDYEKELIHELQTKD